MNVFIIEFSSIFHHLFHLVSKHFTQFTVLISRPMSFEGKLKGIDMCVCVCVCVCVWYWAICKVLRIAV
jgi:hypothetical protein